MFWVFVICLSFFLNVDMGALVRGRPSSFLDSQLSIDQRTVSSFCFSEFSFAQKNCRLRCSLFGFALNFSEIECVGI